MESHWGQSLLHRIRLCPKKCRNFQNSCSCLTIPQEPCILISFRKLSSPHLKMFWYLNSICKLTRRHIMQHLKYKKKMREISKRQDKTMSRVWVQFKFHTLIKCVHSSICEIQIERLFYCLFAGFMVWLATNLPHSGTIKISWSKKLAKNFYAFLLFELIDEL